MQNEPVVTRLMGIDEARTSGARALFGEKYGDEVRVVSMGTIEENGALRKYSVELCGGTHAQRTGDIGLVAIVDEGAVAAGVRRIEARTGEAARKTLSEDSQRLGELANLLKASPAQTRERLEALLDERKRLERELADAKRKLVLVASPGRFEIKGRDATFERTIAGVKIDFRQVNGVDAKDLKAIADEAKQRIESGVVAFVTTGEDGKASLVVAVTPDLTAKYNAVDLVRLGSAALGGKGGGGRPDMAQAGGPEGAKAAEALEAVAAGVRARASA